MSGEIKVDPAAFKEAAAKVGREMGYFEPFVTSFTSNAENCLAGFNSGFADHIMDALRCLGDDDGPTALANIGDFKDLAGVVADGLSAADEQLAGGLEGGE